MKATALLLALAVVHLNAGEHEDIYFREKCLPLVRTFIKRHNLDYDANFPTNKLVHWKVDFYDQANAVLSQLSLERRLVFDILEKNKIVDIQVFKDRKNWKPSLMEPENEKQMHSLAAQTNLFNKSTALAFARECFRRQGHEEQNFHPIVFTQVMWAESVPARRIVFPFYEAEWVRRDVNCPLKRMAGQLCIRMCALSFRGWFQILWSIKRWNYTRRFERNEPRIIGAIYCCLTTRARHSKPCELVTNGGLKKKEKGSPIRVPRRQ